MSGHGRTAGRFVHLSATVQPMPLASIPGLTGSGFPLPGTDDDASNRTTPHATWRVCRARPALDRHHRTRGRARRRFSLSQPWGSLNVALRRARTSSPGRHASPPVDGQAADGTVVAAPVHESPFGHPEHWTKLGDLLVTKQRVSPGQVAEALLQQSASGKPLGRLLVEIGALDERE